MARAMSARRFPRPIPTASQRLRRFMQTPLTRKCWLANFDAVGVGYSYNPDSDGVLYCVQLFYAEKH